MEKTGVVVLPNLPSPEAGTTELVWLGHVHGGPSRGLLL